MFSGLIETTGNITQLSPLQQGQRLSLEAPHLDFDDIRLGDSIALDGVCLTVIEIRHPTLVFDVSAETLKCSRGYKINQRVNLEKALKMGDRLGGHVVLGHVDNVGTVIEYKEQGESWHLTVRVPQELAPFVATKGSITLNGVSLTTNLVEDTPEGCYVHLMLIPHTRVITSLSDLQLSDSINIEIDMMARYACRYLQITQSLSN
ncbi:MAG: riboflavin synthase [Pseudomonadota bacterium]